MIACDSAVWSSVESGTRSFTFSPRPGERFAALDPLSRKSVAPANAGIQQYKR